MKSSRESVDLHESNIGEDVRFPGLEQEFEGSPVDIRIDHLTDWADKFFSGPS